MATIQEKLTLLIEGQLTAMREIEQFGRGLETISKEEQKAAKGAMEAERRFLQMGTALNRGTNTAAAQVSLQSLDRLLKTGAISADQYGEAATKVGLKSGQISPASLAAANSIGTLNNQFASGKINAEQYAQGIDKIEKELKETGKQQSLFGKLGIKSMVDVKAGLDLVSQGLAALKGAWDFAKEGAELGRLRDSFQSLGKSEVDLEKLRKASLGTISDQNLMLAANRAELLGVGASTDDLAKLLEVAAVRGRAMGLSTTAAFNDIVTGVGRASPMILDNLGILTGGAALYDNFARSLGKTADALTEVERKQALFNKVVASSADMGPLIADNATKFEEFETRVENAANASKEFGAEIAVNMMTSLDDLGRTLKGQETTLQREARLFMDMASGSDTAANSFRTLEREGKITRDGLEAMGDKGRLLLADIENLERGLETARLETKVFQQDMLEMSAAFGDADAKARLLAQANVAVAESTDQISDRMDRLQAVMSSGLGEEMSSFREKEQDLIVSRQDILNQLAELTAENGTYIQWNTNANLSTDEVIVAQGRATNAATKYQEAVVARDEAIAAGASTEEISAFNVAVSQSAIASERAQGSLPGLAGAYVNNADAIGELQGKLEEANGALDANAAAHEAAVARIIFSMAQQRAAVDGMTTEEADLLTILAKELGLFDDEAAAAMDSVNDAFDALASGTSLQRVEDRIKGIRDQLLGLPSNIPINFQLTTSGSQPRLPGGVGGQPIALAHGVNAVFTKPTAAVFAEDGPEHVRVTPLRGGARSPGDGGGIKVEVNIERVESDLDIQRLAFQVAAEVQRRIRG